MMLVDIHLKYLGLTLITSKDIKKLNRLIFFSTSQYKIHFSKNDCSNRTTYIHCNPLQTQLDFCTHKCVSDVFCGDFRGLPRELSRGFHSFWKTKFRGPQKKQKKWNPFESLKIHFSKMSESPGIIPWPTHSNPHTTRPKHTFVCKKTPAFGTGSTVCLLFQSSLKKKFWTTKEKKKWKPFSKTKIHTTQKSLKHARANTLWTKPYRHKYGPYAY